MAERGALADHGVPQQAARADMRPGLDHRAARELGARADLDVLPEDHTRVDERGRRVDDRHSRPHPLLEYARVEEPTGMRELNAVVHPADLVTVGCRHRGYP